jgi:chromosomal replication initiation ATPase DnaA
MQDEQAYQSMWRRVCDRLRSEVGNNEFEDWLRHLELQDVAEGGLQAIVIAPTRALQHWVTINHVDRLLELWQAEIKQVSRITIKAPPRTDDDEFEDRMPDDPVPVREDQPEHQDAWRRVLDRFKPEIAEDALNWLRQLELQQVQPLICDVGVTLVAPNTSIRDWVADNYGELIFEKWRAEDWRVGALRIVSPPVPSGIHQYEIPPDLVATRPSQKNRGGRAPKFDWEALWFELIRISQMDWINSRQELRQRTLDWIATNWLDEPSDSVLREKLSRLGDVLNLPTN